MSRRRRPAPSTRAANSDIRSATPSAPRSTIPGLIVACIVGDGEAETGPLATAWQSNKFLDPITDGAVLPILHLNGFKISNPTILARIEHEELEQFFRGCGWTPLFVEGEEPEDDAPADGGDGRRSHQPDPCNPEERARKQRSRAAALAHDRPQIPQGLDRAEGRRRLEDRGHVSGASGSPARRRRASRPCQAAGKLDEELQGGRTLRCERNAESRTRRARAEGQPSDGRQPARQRRDSSARFANAGLSRPCGLGPRAGRGERARHDGARQIPSRRDAPQRGQAQLPHLRSGRDAFEPAWRCL